MSALRILTTVARGKPLVQTPQDHSSALVSLGSQEMGTIAKVKSLQPNIIYLKKKFTVAVVCSLRALTHWKKLQSTGPGCFFIGRFNYAEKGITRSKSNVIWLVCLGIKGPPGILSLSATMIFSLVLQNTITLQLPLQFLPRLMASFHSFIHSYTCFLFALCSISFHRLDWLSFSLSR